MSIAQVLASLEEEIALACAASGRNREEVTLIAVSKTRPAAAVREAYEAGIRDFGENRVQEFLLKQPELADLAVTWHLIGSLQTNKVKAVLPHVALLHSLDRMELAEALAKHAIEGRRVPALIQVNTTAEETKSGVAPEELQRLLDGVRAIPQIELRGLMTIGPLDGTEDEIRHSFSLLRTLRDRVAEPGLPLPLLSMGMSDDFPLAILEGATHVRIGSRIFGDRD